MYPEMGCERWRMEGSSMNDKRGLSLITTLDYYPDYYWFAYVYRDCIKTSKEV